MLCYHYMTGGWTIFRGWDASVFLEQPFEGKTQVNHGLPNGEVREWLDYLNPSEIEAEEDFRDGLQSVMLPQTLNFTFPLGQDTVSVVETRGMTFNEPLNPKSGWYGSVDVLQRSGSTSVEIIRDGNPPEFVLEFEIDTAGFTLPAIFPLFLPRQPGYATKIFPLNDITRGTQFTEIRYRIIRRPATLPCAGR